MWDERNKKDPRYAAMHNYLSQKPAGWLTAFESPEYFTDAIFQMVPSAIIMGESLLAGIGTTAILKSPLAGARATAATWGTRAALGTAVAEFGALQATGDYSEAYLYTMDKTGDEELARSNAALSTAENFVIMAVTEGWGASRLFKRFLPKSFQTGAKKSLLGKLVRENIATPERLDVLRRIGQNPLIRHPYNVFRDPFAEGFQEYVQYMGNVLTQAGYKDETFSELYDPGEMHESVVGGAIFGGIFGGAAAVSRRMQWGEWTGEANRIINEDYGIETNVKPERIEDPTSMAVVITDATPTLENYIKEVNSEEKIQ